MPGRTLRLLAAPALLVGAVVLACAGFGVGTDLLLAVPVLLLLLPLLHGRYVGEERIARIRRARAATRRPRPAAAPLPPRPARVLMARGARLLACSLSVRPPPAAAASS